MSTTTMPNPEKATAAAPLPPSAPPRRSPWAGLRQPTFLVTAGILLAAALGLNSAIYGLALHFRKEPVPLAARLDDAERGLSRKLGHWVAVSKDEPLPEDLEHALGTSEYLFRTYVDGRLVDQAMLDALNDKALDARQRAALLDRVRQQYGPQAVLVVSLTYYTGLADTVAHIPDRCMVADGYEPKTYETHGADFTIAGRPQRVEYRFIHFQDQTGFRREDRNVGYFFHVNGRYASSPQEVRVTMQDLFERNAYYAKVELMNGAKDERQADQVMQDWLAQALPDLERVLPDWNKVKAKKS